jgi:hypothetical protein
MTDGLLAAERTGGLDSCGNQRNQNSEVERCNPQKKQEVTGLRTDAFDVEKCASCLMISTHARRNYGLVSRWEKHDG